MYKVALQMHVNLLPPGSLGPQMSALIPFSVVEVSFFQSRILKQLAFAEGIRMFILLSSYLICVIHIFSLKRTGWTASNPQSPSHRNKVGGSATFVRLFSQYPLGSFGVEWKKYIDILHLLLSTTCLVLFQFISVRKLRIREFLFPIIRHI